MSAAPVTVLVPPYTHATVRERADVRPDDVVLLDRAAATVPAARETIEAWIRLSQDDPCGTAGSACGAFAYAAAITALRFDVLLGEERAETPDGSEERLAFAALATEARALLAAAQTASQAAEKTRIAREMRALAEERAA